MVGFAASWDGSGSTTTLALALPGQSWPIHLLQLDADVVGWQFVSIPFAEFTRSETQVPGAPDDGLTLSEVWEHGFILEVLVGQEFYLDQIQVFDYFAYALGRTCVSAHPPPIR